MKINIDKFIEITNKYMDYKTTCSICGKEHTVIPDSVEVEDDLIFFNIDCEDHRSEYCGTSVVGV